MLVVDGGGETDDGVVVGDVALVGGGAGAEVDGRLLGGIAVDVDGEHPAALGGEGMGRGGADATAGAGDEHEGAGKVDGRSRHGCGFS